MLNPNDSFNPAILKLGVQKEKNPFCSSDVMDSNKNYFLCGDRPWPIFFSGKAEMIALWAVCLSTYPRDTNHYCDFRAALTPSNK